MNAQRFLWSARNCSKKYLGLLFAITTLTAMSLGQSIPGTLTSTESTSSQVIDNCTVTTHKYTWTFTDPAGAAHGFPGESTITSGIGAKQYDCDRYTAKGSLDIWSSDGLYFLEATAASGTVTTASGYINPKYLIMGVTYAPPGGNTQSSAQYNDTSFVGNTSMNSNSFSQNYTESVSISGTTGNVGIGGGLFGFSGGVTVTGTQSNAWTMASNSSKTVTLSKQTSTLFKTPGVPNVYSPVNHDYDIVWLWVNPVVTFTVPATNTSTSGSITWTGYGYDFNDPLHEVDVWPVYVGTLNGDFGTSFDCGGVTQPIDCQDAGTFARSWVTTQTFGPGQGPGITQADYPTILGADPFAVNTGVITNYSLTSDIATFTLNPVAEAFVSTSNIVTGSVVISGIASPNDFLNGTWTVSGTPTTTQFQVNITHANMSSTAISGTASQVITAAQQGASPIATYGVVLEPGTSPLTTTDGRFTQAGVNGVAPQTIPYAQAKPDSTTGENEQYQNTYVSTTTLGQGGSHTYETSYGLEEKVGGTFFGAGVTYDFKQTWSYTWENTWQNTVTNTTTQQDTLSITGPPCPAPVSPCIPQYTIPAEFAAYEDNLYGTFMFRPSPYFSIGPVTPVSQTVKAGASTTYSIPTAANAGYSGTLTSFNVAGLPSGATASFSKSTGAPGFTSTLTVSTAASTPAGTYPLTISATDGSLSNFACVAGCPSSEPYPTLVVSASPGFSVASSPGSDTIAVGGSATYTIITTATNGFNGVVDLTVSGLPVNVSGGFSPETITGSGSSTLTINTTGNTPPGTYALTITATSGSLTETTTATLVVTGANFSLSAMPEFQSIAPGGSATYTVTATASSGFTGTVTLSLPGLPSDATATFSPASISGGNGSSTLTITTTTSIAVEDYSLSITGISGNITQTAPIDLDVE